MGIYIKGVELPTNCLTCPFTEKDDRMGTICYFTNIVALNIGRQEDCPLVYITEPHGRLIDANSLMKYFNVYKYEEWTSEEVGGLINNAPTVIEGSQ